MQIKPSEVSQFCIDSLHNSTIQIQIEKSNSFILDLDNVTPALRNNIEKPDMSLRTFLELLTTQPFLNE